LRASDVSSRRSKGRLNSRTNPKNHVAEAPERGWKPARSSLVMLGDVGHGISLGAVSIFIDNTLLKRLKGNTVRW